MENCPFKASADLSGMRQSFDNQRYPHVIGECMTDKFARVDVDDRGKVLCQMRVFGTGVLGTRYCRVPGSWYRAEGYVGPGR